MKKILPLLPLLVPTLTFAVSVKLTVTDVPAKGVKRGTKLITMVDSRSLNAKDQVLVSAYVRTDGKKYAKSDKQRFDELRAKLLLLGVVLDEEVIEAWMESPSNLTVRSLLHQFIHRGYALSFKEQKEEKGIHIVNLYLFKPDS